ncbi:hypothetical protein BTA51_24345 [Hahella sp. CCB-MM4]|uniref:cytochrome P450 n=1 Tax=Hahella sp. (strain CCB-MM4) TaxID=1926491 RepID=UPI000B9A27F1|nr:cytochrome P450 [Hahella sp. CCB-MM4]OZG70720.1 hypothetical protein BTA51_24345 [Hahella sp. CCB-MM4]
MYTPTGKEAVAEDTSVKSSVADMESSVAKNIFSKTKSALVSSISESSAVQKHLPGPPRISWENLEPLLNNRMHLKLSSLADKYGDVFQLGIAGKDLLVLNGLQTVKKALVDQGDTFSDRADFDILQEAPQRHFLELKSGDYWKRHREVFVGAMHDHFAGRWAEVESSLREEAVELAQYMRDQHGQPFDPNRSLSLANLSFIQKIIFGRRCSQEDKDGFNEYGLTLLPSGFMNAVRLGLLPGPCRPLFYLTRKRSLDNFKEGIIGLSAYIAENVEEHRQSFDPDNIRDMCDRLLEAGMKLTKEERDTFQLHDQDIVNGSLTQFSGAGTGVPTFAQRWAILYLANHPEVQKKAHEELERVVGPDADPKMSDRSKMPYMQAFVNEVLRHSAISPMAAVYYATNKDTSINHYFVKKNTPVIVNYYSITRDPSVWDAPDEFMPERFLDSEGALRKDLQNKFFPFGLGPRRCLGEHLGRMQIFLLCAHLMHHFEFSLAPGEKSDPGTIPGVFLVPKDFRIIATPRR